MNMTALIQGLEEKLTAAEKEKEQIRRNLNQYQASLHKLIKAISAQDIPEPSRKKQLKQVEDRKLHHEAIAKKQLEAIERRNMSFFESYFEHELRHCRKRANQLQQQVTSIKEKIASIQSRKAVRASTDNRAQLMKQMSDLKRLLASMKPKLAECLEQRQALEAKKAFLTSFPGTGAKLMPRKAPNTVAL